MKKKTSGFIGFIGLLLSFIMCVGTLFLTGCHEEDNSVTGRINELYAEKKRIGYNIDKCKNELERLTVTRAAVFFHFESISSELLDIALPTLNEADKSTAIVDVKPEEFEGSSVYNELKNAGWEFAIGFDDSYTFPEDDDEAAKALEDYIGSYGENHPAVISFSSGNAKYRRSFDKTLTKCGISVVIAPKLLLAGGSTYLEYDHEIGLLKVSSSPFSMRNTVESIMRTSINDKHPLALSVNQLEDGNLSAISENISLERFNLMLESLEKYNDVFYGKCSDYKDYVASQHDDNIDKYNEILGRIQEYNLLIEDIEKEISALVGKEVAS